MKKMIYGCLIWACLLSTSYAFTVDELPNQLYLTQHWVSYTTSFDIETKTKKLGTLYRRILSLPLTYDFYDNTNHLLTTAKAKFFAITAQFDVYDDKENKLGSVEEKFFTFLPSFTIYSPEYVKLARAEMNFWGTTFTVYDILTDTPIAVMSRPFFRIKNDWTINFKNKDLLVERNIDVGLFLTTLAFQGDREYWDQQNSNNNVRAASVQDNATPPQEGDDVNEAVKEKVAARIVELNNLDDVPLIEPAQMETLAIKLESDYQAQLNDLAANPEAKDSFNGFVDFCLNLVQSDEVNPSEKKAILYLLQLRLGLEHVGA